MLEGNPIDLDAFVDANLGLIVLAFGAILLLVLLLVVVQLRRVARLQRILASLTSGTDGGNLEDVLVSHLERVGRLSGEVDELAARTAVLEAGARRAFQRIGLVRFNPFEDTGGNQSFAIALLDAESDGLVVSSLHARQGTRIYAKAVSRGRPEGALSDEETSALELARTASLGRAGLAERTGDRGGRDRPGGERVVGERRGGASAVERPAP